MGLIIDGARYLYARANKGKEAPPEAAADPTQPKPKPKSGGDPTVRLLSQALTKASGIKKATADPPLGPVADRFRDLSNLGLKTSDTQIHHAIDCFHHNREALVSFEDKKDLAYSFASEAEIATFGQAVRDPQTLPDSTRELLGDLKTLQDRGYQFNFGRKALMRKVDLRTDAVGAAILIARGERITALQRYGAPVAVSGPSAVRKEAAKPLAVEAAHERALNAVNALEGKGYTVQPDFELPEDIQVGDIGKMMKHQFSERFRHHSANDPRNPVRQREYVLNQLAGNGYAAVALPKKDDDSPMEPQMPSVLNGEQVAELGAVVEGKPSARAQQFLDDMKAIGEKQKPLVMSREAHGLSKGFLKKSDDVHAYVNLLAGGETVLLSDDGTLQKIKSADDAHQLAQTGHTPPPKAAPVDAAQPKTNLLMVYHDAPFDPDKVYEDFPLRATEVGSNDNLDIVMLRSDRPQKKSLRLEYVQKDQLQLLEQMDPKKLMSDPKLLEDFIYHSMQAHPDDKHMRLMVAGHGGAEKGLLPDGESNDAAAHGAMSVDDFADAIHRGLQKFNQETGQQRHIDNLVVASCLMGNTAFIYALAQRGDVRALSASPEMLMGNSPVSFVKYLADGKTADHSAEQFARDAVDQLKGSAAFPGGKKNLQFADTYGAYDLTPGKGVAFKDALNNFFEAAVAEPRFAKYIKDDMAHCPTYGGNAIQNMMFGIQQRDVIQVAERVIGDARIGSDTIKTAARTLVRATQDLVMRQEMNANYRDRRGPTLYMPLDEVSYDESYTKTSLTRDTAHEKFLKMVFTQPLNRTLMETIKYENGLISREIKEMIKEKKAKSKASGATTPEPAKAEAAAKTEAATKEQPAAVAASDTKNEQPAGSDTKAAAAATSADASKAPDASSKADADDKEVKLSDIMKQNQHTQLQGLEKTYRPWYQKAYNVGIATPIRVAFTLAGTAVGTALAAIVLIPTGAILGLRAGIRGNSLAQRIMRDEPGGKHAPKAGAPKPAASPSAPSSSATTEQPAAPSGSASKGQPATPNGSATAAAAPGAIAPAPFKPAAEAETPKDTAAPQPAASEGQEPQAKESVQPPVAKNSSEATGTEGKDAKPNAKASSETASAPSGAKKAPANPLDDISLEELVSKVQRPLTRIVLQAALAPMEAVGEITNRRMSYRFGNGVGVTSGATTGLISGILGGGCTALATGGLLGGAFGNGIARKVFGPHR